MLKKIQSKKNDNQDIKNIQTYIRTYSKTSRRQDFENSN
jgi:hypothetical protein